MSKITNKNIV